MSAGTKLDRKAGVLIAALLTKPTQTAAAKAGVSEATHWFSGRLGGCGAREQMIRSGVPLGVRQ
jgi:hypothetical protein